MLPRRQTFASFNYYNYGSGERGRPSSSAAVRGISNTIVPVRCCGLSLQSTAIARQEKERGFVPSFVLILCILAKEYRECPGAVWSLAGTLTNVRATKLQCSRNKAQMSLTVSVLNSQSHDSKRLGCIEGRSALTMGPLGDNGGRAAGFYGGKGKTAKWALNFFSPKRPMKRLSIQEFL